MLEQLYDVIWKHLNCNFGWKCEANKEKKYSQMK